MAERTLLSNDHFIVSVDAEAGFVKVVRLEAAFSTPAEAARLAEAAFVAAEPSSRKGRGLLFDVRRAPARNDPEFERAMAPVLSKAMSRFPRIALIVRTAVGKLQIKRFGRELGGNGEAEVFFTEEEARAYLRTGQRPAE